MREVEIERIDRRIDALFRDRARQHRRRVKMGERGRRRRVGQIVGGNIDRLHRGDRALRRRGDALLQRAHVGGERRLIADRRGDAAEQRRDFRTRLGEAEDVVDEQQHVLALVAEMLGDGDAGRPTRIRAPGGSFIWPNTSAHFDFTFESGLCGSALTFEFDEFVIEVIAFARALADACENRIAAMGLGDVVDQLLDEHRLADARAAEQADLAALGVGREQVDDLDAGDEDLGFRRLIDIGWGWLMDGAARHPSGSARLHRPARR